MIDEFERRFVLRVAKMKRRDKCEEGASVVLNTLVGFFVVLDRNLSYTSFGFFVRTFLSPTQSIKMASLVL